MSSTPGGSSGQEAVSSSQRSRRPRCPQCGSRRFRKEPSTGLVTCALGHVLQGFREEETQEGEELGSSQATQRTRRRLRREGGTAQLGRRRRSQAARGLLERQEARKLFLQCLQLLLRLQVATIQRELPGVPEEYEGVCRDLWAMHVSTQQAVDAFEMEQVPNSGNASRATSDPETSGDDLESERRDQEMLKLGLDEIMSESGGTSQASPYVSDVNASSAAEYGIADTMTDAAARFVKMRIVQGRHELATLLSILYLGLIALRIPVQWNDIVQLIAACRLPYLHAIYDLPQEMVLKLPKVEIVLLDQTRVPDASALYRHTLKFAADLHDNFEVTFPPINALPIVWRCVERLSLPPPFYVAVKRLLETLKLPMTAVTDRCTSVQDVASSIFGDSINSMRSAAQLEPVLVVSMNRQSVPREVLVMAATVIVAKMYFGLDGIPRGETRDHVESIVGFMSCEAWMKQLQSGRRQYLADPLAVYDANSRDTIDLNDKQLDEYLDFAERLLVHPIHSRIHTWRTRANVSDILSCDREDVAGRHPLLDFEQDLLDPQNTLARPRQISNSQPILGRQAELVESDAIVLQASLTDTATGTAMPPAAADDRPGDEYTIYHPSQEHADQLSRSTSLRRKQQDIRRSRGRPRKLGSRSRTAEGTEEWVSVQMHPHLRTVLDFARRLVGTDFDRLASSVYHLETHLVKMAATRDRARSLVERREAALKAGKRPPGRPSVYNLDHVMWSQTASASPMLAPSPLSASHVASHTSSPAPASSQAFSSASAPSPAQSNVTDSAPSEDPSSAEST